MSIIGSAFIGLIESMAKRWITDQEIHDGDWYDDNDILICGKCGEPRQQWREMSDGTESVTGNAKKILVTRMCKCEREQQEQEKLKKERDEEMKKIKYLQKISLMDNRYESATFESFQKNECNIRNFKMCKRYATAFDEMLEKKQGLLLWGNVGTGKSFAAACIANYLLQQKVPVVMTSFVKILEITQKQYDEAAKIINRLEKAKLVIFDDFGAERSTEYAIEKVYNIIDSRYRSGLPMILTTNITLDEMKSEQDVRYKRIYDRVFEVCYPMHFSGQSFRMIQAASKFDEMKNFFESDD